MDIKEIRKIFKTKIEQEIQKLSQENRLEVKIPKTINKFHPNHPKGALLIAYGGSVYEKQLEPMNIITDRDRIVKVFIVCKNFTEGMQADEYVDFVIDAMSGIEIENKAPRKKIFPLRDEFLDEDENSFWWYSVEFGVPDRYFEKNLREQ